MSEEGIFLEQLSAAELEKVKAFTFFFLPVVYLA